MPQGLARPAQPVTLEEVLLAREQRVERQQELLSAGAVGAAAGSKGEDSAYSLVSVTLVVPGPVKNGPVTDRLFTVAMETVDAVVAQEGWPVRQREERGSATGPEAFVLVGVAAEVAKRALARLEDTHELGRLLDLDVLDPHGTPVPRTAVGLPERACLLCERPSRECARSRAHSVPELRAHIVEAVALWESGR